eukprot:scaffold4349_cov178-Ochromonas_danica.AAC.4
MADLLEEDDDFKYEEIPLDGEGEEQDDGDGPDADALLDAFNSLQLKNKLDMASTSQGNNNGNNNGNSQSVITQVRPSVVDDFVRNFLIKAGMKRTLDIFNTEWYELQSKGKLPNELSTAVPDIYLRNEDLDQQTKQLREQVEKMREVATKAQATWDKFRKERDFHRMHHQRVLQEKAKVVDDLRRLKQHMRSYEPAIEELKRRHETAMKEKMLIRLERDRLRVRVKALEEQVTALQQPPTSPDDDNKNKKTATRSTLRGHVDSVNAAVWQPATANVVTASGDKTVSVWDGRTGLCVQTLYGHSNSVNHLAVTNKGDVVVTADADGIVKVWDIRMVAELGTIEVGQYPINSLALDRGGHRALCASDDGTIKVVDLSSFHLLGQLTGHSGAVQCLAVAPNDSCVISGASDANFKIWSNA